MLTTLIYISKAATPLADDELINLLAASRERNEAKGISGMLMYVKQQTPAEVTGRFIQVLEGDANHVTQLYNTIKADRRHRQVTLLHQGSISTRTFNGWAMGFKSLSWKEYRQLPGYLKLDDKFIKSKTALSSGVAFNFLKTFYTLQAQ